MATGKKGLFIFDIAHNHLQAYTNQQLGLPDEVIYGMAAGNPPKTKNEMLLATDTAFVWLNEDCRITQTIPYRFAVPWLHGSMQTIKDVYPIQRRNGDIVLLDFGRLIIYHSATRTFTSKPFSERGNMYVFSSILQDEKDNVFF